MRCIVVVCLAVNFFSVWPLNAHKRPAKLGVRERMAEMGIRRKWTGAEERE